MELLAIYKDEYFPKSYIDHDRLVSRGIIINEKNEVLMLYISRDDEFGTVAYYETPGGGVKKDETLPMAGIREVEEECGLLTSIVAEIGIVEDDYNLIHRHNVSCYFLLKVEENTDFKREEYETRWIKNMSYVEINKLIEIMNHRDSPIKEIVYKREQLVLLKLKELLKIWK